MARFPLDCTIPHTKGLLCLPLLYPSRPAAVPAFPHCRVAAHQPSDEAIPSPEHDASQLVGARGRQWHQPAVHVLPHPQVEADEGGDIPNRCLASPAEALRQHALRADKAEPPQCDGGRFRERQAAPLLPAAVACLVHWQQLAP
eukprot:gene11961-biopygen7713